MCIISNFITREEEPKNVLLPKDISNYISKLIMAMFGQYSNGILTVIFPNDLTLFPVFIISSLIEPISRIAKHPVKMNSQREIKVCPQILK